MFIYINKLSIVGAGPPSKHTKKNTYPVSNFHPIRKAYLVYILFPVKNEMNTFLRFFSLDLILRESGKEN